MSVAFSDHFVLLNELARYRARGRAQEMAA
jgi:hypothetical protein